ncbi:hypothetical protein [Vibrio anguillarum]|uniref:Uncharacterized protein n=1 Tax=Vibrio anguillarum TaxID=55601 RepID=A0A7U6FS31_VIBAN|nr:hypothetical protein [Vibrio anguillarum]AZS26282.1 hypothetical protein DYL72_15345 [Vibrio anguillarum]MBF4374563.1 hypothetical protein [Vibrio anguillarum]MBF4437537.1 hypothetical protein [Vibrio anguillarum]
MPFNDDLHFSTTVSLWNEFSLVEVDKKDQLESHWLHFNKGDDKTEVWHWFENSFGYPIATLMHGEPSRD